MDYSWRDTTMVDLEKHMGLSSEYEVDPESSLSIWYGEIREKKICDLTVFDLARCLRQGIFPEHIIFGVIEIIKSDPFGGDLFDGELIRLMSTKLDVQFWRNNKKARKRLIEILKHHPLLSKPDFNNWTQYDPLLEDLDEIKRDLDSLKIILLKTETN